MNPLSLSGPQQAALLSTHSALCFLIKTGTMAIT